MSRLRPKGELLGILPVAGIAFLSRRGEGGRCLAHPTRPSRAMRVGVADVEHRFHLKSYFKITGSTGKSGDSTEEAK